MLWELGHLTCGDASRDLWLQPDNVQGRRHQVFIEYAPGERAWRPILAPGWLVIHCLWVSGQYARQGHGRRLVESCIDDASSQGKAGVVVAAAKTKRPFLSDPKFLQHLGFIPVDAAGEYRLFVYRLDGDAADPRFAPAVKRAAERGAGGGPFVARHTDQCPFNLHWARQMADTLEGEGFDVRVERLTSKRQAQSVSSPLGTFGLERDGELVSHHLNTDGALRRLLAKLVS